MLLAAQPYAYGWLSLGQAAELAGYSKRTFVKMLDDYGVAVFNLSEKYSLSDIENAGPSPLLVHLQPRAHEPR